MVETVVGSGGIVVLDVAAVVLDVAAVVLDVAAVVLDTSVSPALSSSLSLAPRG